MKLRYYPNGNMTEKAIHQAIDVSVEKVAGEECMRILGTDRHLDKETLKDIQYHIMTAIKENTILSTQPHVKIYNWVACNKPKR